MNETRVLPIALNTRATSNDDTKIISGEIRYNTESQILTDGWGDQFIETLAAGCFDESLKDRDVVALWSHDTGKPLGSTKNSTLQISSDDNALSFTLALPDTTAGNDAWASIKRGDVDGVSFGLRVTADRWQQTENGIYKRTVLNAELYEISPVVFPAYGNNEVNCCIKRSYEQWRLSNMNKNTTVATEPATVTEPTQQRNATPAPAQQPAQQPIAEPTPAPVVEPMQQRSVPPVAIPAAPKDHVKEQRAAFNQYLRTGAAEHRDSPLMVSNSGGMLAPEDYAKEIIDGLTDEVIIRQIARILPAVSGKSAIYPRRTGGQGAAMVAEGQAIAPADMTFDQVVLVPKKAATIVEVSNELLADQGVDIAGYLLQHFIDEIGELLEGQYLAGNSTGANLQGILTAEDSGTKLIKRISSSAAAITADDILSLWSALPAKYRRNASFVCSSAMEAVLRNLQDGNGQYLMLANLADGMGNTLLGRPLMITEAFPSALTTGTDALMVGDFNHGVYIADKAGIDIQRNDAIGFNKDTVAFRAIFRTDIALAWPDALRVLAIK